MKLKKLKKVKVDSFKKVPPLAEVVVHHVQAPPPDYLLAQADKEPDRGMAQDYDSVIRKLRDEKGFTFREIADWLEQNGVDMDHNSVYRQYTKGLSESAHQVVERQDAEEQNEER